MTEVVWGWCGDVLKAGAWDERWEGVVLPCVEGRCLGWEGIVQLC